MVGILPVLDHAHKPGKEPKEYKKEDKVQINTKKSKIFRRERKTKNRDKIRP